MRGLLVAVLAATLVGCGDRGNQVDFGGDDIGPDLYAIHGEDGAVKMALTQEWVYFALSDSIRAEAEAELEADAEGDGARGFFGGLMQSVLGRALSFRAKYAVSEIEDIRWEDGRMRVVFVDPDRTLDDNLQFSSNDEAEGKPVSEAFAQTDVEAFAEAFRAVKLGTVRSDGMPSQR